MTHKSTRDIESAGLGPMWYALRYTCQMTSD